MTPYLILDNVSAGYGASTVIENISLQLSLGENLAVLGRNGMGKTTLLATLMGLTQTHQGRIILNSQRITSLPTYRRAQMGLGWVAQERAVFGSLSVDENLRVVARPGSWDVDRVYDCFPRLAERRHNAGLQLSGGEQQMLAVARALMTNPQILLLDEPLEGLAPMVAQDLLRTLATLGHDNEMSIIVVEQHPQQILSLAQHAIILERGRIVYRGAASALQADPAAQDRWLGLNKT